MVENIIMIDETGGEQGFDYCLHRSMGHPKFDDCGDPDHDGDKGNDYRLHHHPRLEEQMPTQDNDAPPPPRQISSTLYHFLLPQKDHKQCR